LHGHFYLNSTYHLPHKSTNTNAFRSILLNRKLHSFLPPSNQATRSLWPPIFSSPSRHSPRTEECVIPQPAGRTPLRSVTTQIHDPRRLSLLEFNVNIQPTHSRPPSRHRLSHPPLRPPSPSQHNPQNRVYHPTPAQRAEIQHDHLQPFVFRPFECSTCPLREGC